jgi:hypothetical protein
MHVPHKRRVVVALVPALIALALSASSASATVLEIGAEIDESAYPDGHDYLLTWRSGGWVQTSRGGLGTLSTSTNAAKPMSTNGLTLLKTICFSWGSSGPVQGRHCFKKYKGAVADSDPNHNYRLWWVTGSTAATSGHRLVAVRDGFNTSTTGVSIAEWRPTSTVDTGSCVQTTTGLSLVAYGITASISTQFTVCPETFGPSFVGERLFRFRWDGDRAAGKYVGAGGGVLYAIPPGTSATFLQGVKAWYTS